MTSLSIRFLRSWKPCSSFAATCAARLAASEASSWVTVPFIRAATASAGEIAATGSVGEAFSACDSLPRSIIALPPLSTGPENASCSDLVSSLTLLTFVEEIANSTTNTANSSVIMS